MRYTEIIIDITILIPFNSDKYIYKKKIIVLRIWTQSPINNKVVITHKAVMAANILWAILGFWHVFEPSGELMLLKKVLDKY